MRSLALRGGAMRSLALLLLLATARGDYVLSGVYSGATCTGTPWATSVNGASACSVTGTTASSKVQCVNSSYANTLSYATSTTCAGTPQVVPMPSTWGCVPSSGSAPTQNTTCVSSTYTSPVTGFVLSRGGVPTCPVTSPTVVTSYGTNACFQLNATASRRVTCGGGVATISEWSASACVCAPSHACALRCSPTTWVGL